MEFLEEGPWREGRGAPRDEARQEVGEGERQQEKRRRRVDEGRRQEEGGVQEAAAEAATAVASAAADELEELFDELEG